MNVSKCQDHAVDNQHLPRGVRSFVLRKRKVWRRWRANPTTENKNILNKVSRQCNIAINAHHAQQEQRLLQFGPREFFRYITNQLRPRSSDILF